MSEQIEMFKDEKSDGSSLATTVREMSYKLKFLPDEYKNDPIQPTGRQLYPGNDQAAPKHDPDERE